MTGSGKDALVLDDSSRARLSVVADFLIPSSGDFPSASEAGVADELIDRALGFRPDLAAEFEQGLAAVDGADLDGSIDRLIARTPEQFEALSTLISGAYFLSPAVQKALNYKPAPRQAHDDVDTYVDMLEAVVDRGFDIHGADLR